MNNSHPNTISGAGGSIFIKQSKLRIFQSHFSNDYAANGGSVYSNDSELVIHDSVFENNFAGSVTFEISSFSNKTDKSGIYVAHGQGGAIVVAGMSVLKSYQSHFNNNFAYYAGGSLYSTNSSLLIHDSMFENNTASLLGGAISSFNHSTVTIWNSSFVNNKVQEKTIGKGGNYSEYPSGGAILIDRSELNTNLSLFSNNYAPFQGGSVHSFSSSVLINCSFFENNTAGQWGGAITGINSTSLSIYNSCFINNGAQDNARRDIGNIYDYAGTAGGAILIFQSKLDISQSDFSDNYAHYQGGSVFASESTLSIVGSEFTNNIASVGGAINIGNKSFLTIVDSSLVKNTAVDGILNNGGGFFLKMNCTVNISNVTFLENNVDGQGGAIYAESNCKITIVSNSLFVGNTGSAITLVIDNSLVISDSEFRSNSRAISGISHCMINITDTTFIHNKARDGGSIFVSMATSVYLQNCSFTNNSARSQGGVINAVNSNVNVSNCNFSGNMAKSGGVFTIQGILFVVDSLIVNNTAGYGDGAVAYSAENTQIHVRNSTFRANTAFHHGGVFWMRRGTAYIWNSFFVQNRAEFKGGVIYAEHFNVVNISESICLEKNVINDNGGMTYGKSTAMISVSNS